MKELEFELLKHRSHSRKSTIDAPITSSIELKSSQQQMKRAHSAIMMEKNSGIINLKKSHKAKVEGLKEDIPATKEMSRKASGFANKSRKKALTAEQVSQRHLVKLQEYMKKCATLRDEPEKVSKRCHNLDEELIEQRDDLEDLLENRHQIIDELEHEWNEAMEELNMRLIYVCYVFI